MTNEIKRNLFLLVLPNLALIPPILEHLRGMHSPQIMIIAVVIVSIVCGIFGLVLVLLERNSRRERLSFRFILFLLLASIVFVYFDISFNGFKIFGTVMSFSSAFTEWEKFLLHMLFSCFCISIIGVIIWKFEVVAVDVLAVLFAVIFVSTLFISGQKPFDNWKRGDLEPITGGAVTGGAVGPTEIIIILDGMLGAEGVDRSLPGGRELYTNIKDFHERHGFKLFGKAFSRSASTTTSIPSTLNYLYSGTGDVGELTQKLNGSNYLVSNKYFDEAHASGQDVVVFQAPYLNFCRHMAVSQCTTLNSFDPFNGFLPVSVSRNKFTLALVALKESTKKTILTRYLGIGIYELARYFELNFGSGSFFVPDNAEYSALSFNSFFDEFKLEVLKTKGGTTFFAHFLFPHAPYALDSECNPNSVWPTFPRSLTQHLGLKGSSFEAARRKHYLEYFDQVRCAYKKLGQLLDEMRTVDGFMDTTIILMGDHGSRISEGSSIEFLSSRGIIDNFSTLFSTKRPNKLGEYDTTPISVQQLFGSVRSDGFNISNLRIENTIIIPTMKKSSPDIVAIPDF